MQETQTCTRCVMNNKSDTQIVFKEGGHCNYCTDAISRLDKVYFPNQDGKKLLDNMINRLKEENENNQYDCIMGISGGLDSSYLAYLGAVKWKLKIFAVHVDDGFDTEISKQNIHLLCKAAKIKIVTIKPDEKQYNELIRAYIFAGVPNLAAIQDNVLLAYIYDYAKQYHIRQFLSGGNFALESILQSGNTHDNSDVRNIKDINRKFGREKTDKLKFLSSFQKDIDLKLLKIETPKPLNYIDYNRDRALKELNDFCGFQYYGSKHCENTFTKFLQLYWMPNKFNVDKRTSHLSSMIVSGQMSREEALKILREPLYDRDEMLKEIAFILERLDITEEEFSAIMKEKPRQHTDFKTSNYSKIRKVFSKISK